MFNNSPYKFHISTWNGDRSKIRDVSHKELDLFLLFLSCTVLYLIKATLSNQRRWTRSWYDAGVTSRPYIKSV